MGSLTEFSLGEKMKPKGKIQAMGIVGCGAVGQQIALLASRSGMDVVFVDVSTERIKEIYSDFELLLDDIIRHWGLTPSEKKLVLSRMQGTIDFGGLSKCDIVIETISSRQRGTMLPIRQEIFRKIEEVVRKDAVISSNTATLMISELATVLKHPERAVGLHFIDPIEKTQIVELVMGIKTSETAFEKVNRFVKMMDRKGIHVHESPGNISTRMIIPLINEACDILMEGVASVQDIDETMSEISGYNTGPFELADRIGLDKILKYMENLYAEFGEKKYKASPVIKRLVRANYLGKQTGKGFYTYEKGKKAGNTITCTIIR